MKPSITLQAWAANHFDPPPQIGTLRGWVRNDKIHPRPIKVGRTYMVLPDAQYISSAKTDNVVDRGLSSSVSSGALSERAARILNGQETNNGQA